ncbi:hypothetical protein FLP10_10925 [Agromyces intestinalis]|uniref:Transferase n=1 Tax=Agromyces intestinalis TaxID=2592652 RepID=A0A5C1YH34_9MICO|nr:hypothetical protein FLP10_10925 [Agromyces intestinalis]
MGCLHPAGSRKPGAVGSPCGTSASPGGVPNVDASASSRTAEPRECPDQHRCCSTCGRIRASRREESVGISYVEFEDENGVLRRYRKHVNGRGLVATTAKVDPTAFVDPTAYVDPGAEVQRHAVIGPGGWVDRDAIVAERAEIGVRAHVGRGAVVGRNAVVGPYASIGAAARVQNGARVPREAKVAEGDEYRASTEDLRRLGLAA